MLASFKSFISAQKLVTDKDRVLLTVSGGVDSVVMASLFKEAAILFAIAHCNFGLRGAESDADEKFVKQLAATYGVPFYSVRFDTEKEAKAKGISIQMAARELRYNWFSALAEKEGYNKIATAHHQTDLFETQLINLVRGTGLAGLKGIAVKQGNIIRPLLCATRAELFLYASTKELSYREDSSNASDKYTRNKIRHHVLPVLEEINPSVINTAWENSTRFVQDELLNVWAIQQFKEKHVTRNADEIVIQLEGLADKAFASVVLYELLAEYGFNGEQVKNILSGTLSGRQFDSATHRLFTDRNQLLVRLKNLDKQADLLQVDLNNAINNFAGFTLKINRQNYETDFIIPRSNTVVCLDAAKLQTPLELRKWQKGDYFYPLGMNKRKLLSDFFIDNKLSATEKENTQLLTSAGAIVWIIGYRIDERFKITANTKELLIVEIEKQ